MAYTRGIWHWFEYVKDGVLVEEYDSNLRPEPRAEVLRLGQKTINWLFAGGEPPTEDEIRRAIGPEGQSRSKEVNK